MAKSDLYTSVQDHYSRIARDSTQETAAKSEKVALSFGYSAAELSGIPDGANLGVSCGNPIAIAALKEGETVVDLGCGAGFDVFLAARLVGDKGIAIGVDMSIDMLTRARANAARSSIANVRFVESTIISPTLPSASTDCIISNCVINLVPEADKHLVFSEIFRVLKPGGRVAVSDILAKKDFPEELQKSMSLYVGCISGASTVGGYETYLRDAGFKDIMIVDKHIDLNVYKENKLLIENGEEKSTTSTSPLCCPPTGSKPASSCRGSGGSLDKRVAESVANIDFNDWVASFNIYAIKP